MSAFTVICPNCSSLMEVQDEWIGMEAECPSCQKKFQIEKKQATQLPDSEIKLNHKNVPPAIDASKSSLASDNNTGGTKFQKCFENIPWAIKNGDADRENSQGMPDDEYGGNETESPDWATTKSILSHSGRDNSVVRKFQKLQERKKYFFGWAYIYLSWVIASLIILLGVVYCVYTGYQALTGPEDRRQSITRSIAKLRPMQKEFVTSYFEMISQLKKKGISLPDNVMKQKFFFNEALANEANVDLSLSVIGVYKRNISEIKNVLAENKEGIAYSAERLVSSVEYDASSTEKELRDLQQDYVAYAENRKAELKQYVKDTVLTILATVFAAFFIMVLADYLRAHFEGTEILFNRVHPNEDGASSL